MDNDSLRTEYPDANIILNFRQRAAELLEETTLGSACDAIADAANFIELDLLAVTICDQIGEKPSIRPYRNQPDVVFDLSKKLQKSGDCPIIETAKRVGSSFDALTIPIADQSSFLAKRYLEELAKLNHQQVLVFPVGLGRGMAIFTVGTRSRNIPIQNVYRLDAEFCRCVVKLLARFPDIASLFEGNLLNLLETKCLLLLSSGSNLEEIGNVMGLSETTISAIVTSAKTKLGCSTATRAVSLAQRLGEIHKVQLGNQD